MGKQQEQSEPVTGEALRKAQEIAREEADLDDLDVERTGQQAFRPRGLTSGQRGSR